MKKSFVFTLIMILIVSLNACGPGNDEYIETDNRISVAMVTDINGFGKDPFNDALLVGLERAKSEFDVNLIIYESSSIEQYANNLAKAASGGADLIISRGFLMADATKLVAEYNPHTKFAIIDYGDITAENLTSITFNEQEGSFLMGVIAALQTHSNIVGFIGGMKFPKDERYEYGFKAGVKTLNPDITVLSSYTGSDNDDTLCKAEAIAQSEQGADVIYHAAGQCQEGIIEAALEKGFWVIDAGQKETGQFESGESESAVICIMRKNVENVMYLTVKKFIENEMPAGNLVFGLKENGVDLNNLNNSIGSAVIDKIQDYKKLIIENQIMVPYDQISFETFQPPEL